jgi:hypothetical protein
LASLRPSAMTAIDYGGIDLIRRVLALAKVIRGAQCGYYLYPPCY